MQTRINGQKEYELAVKLLSKQDPTDRDYSSGMELLLRSFDQGYAPAIRFHLTMLLKEINLVFERIAQSENDFLQKMRKNPKVEAIYTKTPVTRERNLMMALQVPYDLKIHKEGLVKLAMPLPQAKYLYATKFEEDKVRKQQLLKEAAMEGLPIAQLQYAFMEITGYHTPFSLYDKVMDSDEGLIHFSPILQAFVYDEEKLLESKLTAPRLDFDFEDAMEVLAKPPAPYADLAESIAKTHEIGARKGMPAAGLVQAVRMMELPSEKAQETAFDMIRRAACAGNTHALHMLSFMIILVKQSYPEEKVTIVTETESERQKVAEGKWQLRDKILFTMLENKKIREIISKDYGNERSYNNAKHYLDICESETNNEARSSHFTILTGNFFHLSANNSTLEELEYANESIDKLMKNSSKEFNILMLDYFLKGTYVPQDFLRACQIIEFLAESNYQPAQYMYARLLNLVCGTDMPADLKALNDDVKLNEDREKVNKIARDAKVVAYLKAKLSKKTDEVKEAKQQPGEEEYREAEKLSEKFYMEAKSGVKLTDKMQKLRAKQIITLLERAAEKKHAMAKYALGNHFISGNITKRDDVRAFKLFHEAAEAGVKEAKAILNGMMSAVQHAHLAYFTETQRIIIQRLLANKDVIKLFETAFVNKVSKHVNDLSPSENKLTKEEFCELKQCAKQDFEIAMKLLNETKELNQYTELTVKTLLISAYAHGHPEANFRYMLAFKHHDAAALKIIVEAAIKGVKEAREMLEFMKTYSSAKLEAAKTKYQWDVEYPLALLRDPQVATIIRMIDLSDLKKSVYFTGEVASNLALQQVETDKHYWFTNMLLNTTCVVKQIGTPQTTLAIENLNKNVDSLKDLKELANCGEESAQLVLAYIIFNANLSLIPGYVPLSATNKIGFLEADSNLVFTPAATWLDKKENRDLLKAFDNLEEMRKAELQLTAFIKQMYERFVAALLPYKGTTLYVTRMKLLEEKYQQAKTQITNAVAAYSKHKEKSRPVPEFKSEFLGALGSKKKKPDIDKIIATDPLFLIKVVLGLVYKNLDVTDEIMQELKAKASTLSQCERSPEFWRLLNDGMAYGRGEAFMHKLKELGFAQPLFGESSKLDWDYIEWRAAYFDTSLKNKTRPLYYNEHKEVYPNYLPALFIGKELKRHKQVTPDDVKAVKEKFKIPDSKASPLLFFRTQCEKDRKERLIAKIVEKERKKTIVRWY